MSREILHPVKGVPGIRKSAIELNPEYAIEIYYAPKLTVF